MSNKLKAITTKAKALYKSGKYAKWTDAIKEASKSLAKTTVKKTKSGLKSLAKKVYESKHLSGVKKKTAKKKVATKKKLVKKSPVRNYGSHKDTASHNVRISVVSGLSEHWIKELNSTIKVLLEKEKVYKLHKAMSTNKIRSKELKHHDKKMVAILKPQIAKLKKHLTQIKKHIK